MSSACEATSTMRKPSAPPCSRADPPLALPAYDQCMKASHLFNLLDARGAISVVERAAYIGRVRAGQGLLRGLAGGGGEVTCSRSFHAHARRPNHVMAGLVPAIHVFVQPPTDEVEGDARNESGHDDESGRAGEVARANEHVAYCSNSSLVSTSHA